MELEGKRFAENGRRCRMMHDASISIPLLGTAIDFMFFGYVSHAVTCSSPSIIVILGLSVIPCVVYANY